MLLSFIFIASGLGLFLGFTSRGAELAGVLFAGYGLVSIASEVADVLARVGA